jgi:DNA polymerase-1
MSRLVLIDGNAILHRAFHALPPLTTKDGKPVNAIYGFTTMMLRLIHDLAPTHIAVAFDRPAPTFRKGLYKEYQAKRPKMDDELVPQVEGVHEVLRGFQIPIFEMDGYEADDVIGTITNYELRIMNKKKNIDQIIIVTGDKDILQLVQDEKVLVYMPTKGLSEGKLYGEKETEERLGVEPKKIPDFKALAGDASDNYPGIAGIGPKTAVQILKETGSIENLYKRIEKKHAFALSEALTQKIKEGKESALLSHKLATIHTDVPIELDIPEFSEMQLKQKQACEVLQQFGFQSIIKRLEKIGTGEKQEKKQKKGDETEQLGLV